MFYGTNALRSLRKHPLNTVRKHTVSFVKHAWHSVATLCLLRSKGSRKLVNYNVTDKWVFTKPAALCFTVLNIRIRPLYHVSTEMSEVSPCFCLGAVLKFTWNFKTYTNNTQLHVPKIQKRIRPHNKSVSYNTTPSQVDPSFVSPQPLIIFMLYCVICNLPYRSHTTNTEPSTHCTTHPVTEKCFTLYTGTNVCKYCL